MKIFTNLYCKSVIFIIISVSAFLVGCISFSMPNTTESDVITLCTATPRQMPEIHDLAVVPSITPVPVTPTPFLPIPSANPVSEASMPSPADDIEETPLPETEIETASSCSNSEPSAKTVRTHNLLPTATPVSTKKNVNASNDDLLVVNEDSFVIPAEIMDSGETFTEKDSSVIQRENVMEKSFSEEPKEAEEKKIDFTPSGPYSAEELELVARVAYFEAGSFEGRNAVMNVIYNRCKSNKFGGKETSVSTEINRKSQFSVINNSKFSEMTAPASLISAADDIFNKNNLVMPENVYYFRAEKKGTEWEGKVYYCTIGGNAFFSAE